MKLGKRQFELLAKICKSNGGGVYVSGSGPEYKIIRRLEEMGLIQGKSGQPYMAVHTPAGFNLYKLESGDPK